MKKTKKNLNKSSFDTVTSQSELIQPEPDNSSLWQDPFVHILLILATGFIVYFNSISVPFVFDDLEYILKNPAIKSFSCFPDTQKVMDFSIYADIKNNVILRPVTYFTFAVNYAIHGYDLFGYHLVSLLLHLGSAMLVYYFFSQLLVSGKLSNPAEKDDRDSRLDNLSYMPLFAALLFVCHPLQTQAVTYIVQRFVPLTTFFYLAALVLYAQFRRASTSKLRVLTYITSLTAAVLAMESKEIAFTLPVIIALFEFMFLSGNLVPRFVRLIPFFLTMAIIPVKLLHLPAPASPDKTENISGAINLVNFGGISSGDYLMTQFGVITTYIRLLFLPIRQNFDYDYPLQQSFFKLEVLLPFALLLVIVGGGFYFLSRSRENHLYKIIAFGIFWFFITLSVESSVVPIADLIFEHRAYLPSIGFFMAFMAGVAVIFNSLTGKSIARSKMATLLLIVIVVALSTAAIARNMVWQDDVSFMNDTVKKSPNKARTHIGLGEALIRQAIYVSEKDSKLEGMMLLKDGSDTHVLAAIIEFETAIRLEPKSPAGHVKLAEALRLQKNFAEALRSLSTASRLQPKSSIPYVMRGEIFEAKNDFASARKEYLEAFKIEPFSYMPHLKLADIYTREGNIQSAIKELEFVMRVYPDEAVRKKLDKLKAGPAVQQKES